MMMMMMTTVQTTAIGQIPRSTERILVSHAIQLNFASYQLSSDFLLFHLYSIQLIVLSILQFHQFHYLLVLL